MNTTEGLINLRPVTPADEQFLLNVVGGTHPEFAGLGLPPAQIAGLVRMQFLAQRRGYEASYPDAEENVVLRAETPVGRFWVSRTKTEIHVLDISLLPEYRRQGIGSHLYRLLMVEAKASGRPVRCSVFQFNQPSKLFHQRLGFEVISDNGMTLELEWRRDQI